MNEEIRVEELNKMLEAKQLRQLKETLGEMNEADIATFMEDLPPEKTVLVFRMLPKELATDVFAFLESDQQEDIINGIKDKEISNIIEDLYVDDAVDMLEELPASVVKRVLKNATADTRNLINEFLKYPDNSAGSIMTTEYIGLKKTMSVEEAFAYIRKHGVDKETIYTCYVRDEKRVLIGVVTVKDLLMASYDVLIEDLMDTNIIKATTTQDREEIVELFNKYDFLSLPVVDNEGRLVGIITVDDVVDVMEEEATEDFEKMAAMLPSEKPYLKTSIWELSKNRLPWLLILMFSSMVTGGILGRYEDAFAVLPILVTFVPMLTDTGGNAGSQSATMVIRGMAIGEIEVKDALKVIWKEIGVGIICGFVLAAANFVRLYLQLHGRPITGEVLASPLMISLTVVISVFFTVLLSKVSGAVLPIIAEKLKLDPAIMASPLITTIVDAFSLIIYFQIAVELLHIK